MKGQRWLIIDAGEIISGQRETVFCPCFTGSALAQPGLRGRSGAGYHGHVGAVMPEARRFIATGYLLQQLATAANRAGLDAVGLHCMMRRNMGFNDYFSNKFVGKVSEIFSGLPKPKDPISFTIHDLPLLFTADEVQVVMHDALE